MPSLLHYKLLHAHSLMRVQNILNLDLGLDLYLDRESRIKPFKPNLTLGLDLD